mgnify:CR=1 FL=1
MNVLCVFLVLICVGEVVSFGAPRSREPTKARSAWRCSSLDADAEGRAEKAAEAKVDSYLMADSMMGLNIEDAVARLIEDDKKKGGDGDAADMSPSEKFKQIYNSIKASDGTDKNTTILNATAMLASLFPEEKLSTPFDERKVMMKLRRDLDEQDFKDTFLSPEVGEIY